MSTLLINEIRKPNVLITSSEASVIEEESELERDTLIKLDYPTWLPFAAKLYEISPDIEDYILVNTPICPSDLPNRNGIGFPLAELTRFIEPPVSRMAYKAWSGCPVHYEHKNEIHKDAYGVILDASLHKVTGYGGGKLWKVMGILAIDKKKYPKMAERVRTGEVNTYSMGALVDRFTCSYCGTELTKHSHCHHINPGRVKDYLSETLDWNPILNYDNTKHIAFRNAHGINPIETSIVESPAWTTALSDTILTNTPGT